MIKDEEDPKSDNDFGKNLIPAMLDAGENMFAYEFKGYWKDVGTIDSLWEANMDILDPDVPIELDDPPWRIYSRSSNLPPHYVGSKGKISNSSIADGCYINGTVENSILFPGVRIEEGAAVSNSILMPGVLVGEDASVEYAIVASKVSIGEKAVIDGSKEKITVIGENISIGPGLKVKAGASVEKNLGEEVAK